MHRVYGFDEIVPITMPGDDDNPTIYHVKPMLAKDRNRHQAMLAGIQRHFAKVAEVAEDDVAESDKMTDEETSFIAGRVPQIDNAWDFKSKTGSGVTKTSRADILEHIQGMAAEDRNVLITATLSSRRLEELRKQ